MAMGVTDVLAALAEPTRLGLVEIMSDGEEHCICELQPRVSVSQSRLSRHMGLLRQAGLVSARRDRQWVRFRLDPEMRPEVRAIVDAALAARRAEEDKEMKEKVA